MPSQPVQLYLSEVEDKVRRHSGGNAKTMEEGDYEDSEDDDDEEDGYDDDDDDGDDEIENMGRRRRHR